MKPLREANPDTQGVPYYCLDFATRVFDVPNKYYFAWEAWENAQYKHTDPLPDVPVPMWFAWEGSVEGEWRNWGHVTVWFPGRGILSSPFSKNYKQQWFDSPEALISYLGGGEYVGWSEDINGVRVVEPQGEEEMVADFEFVVQAYWSVLHRNYEIGQVTKEEIEGQVGRRAVDVLADMRSSKEWLTGNHYWLRGAGIQQQLTELQSQKPDARLVKAKELAKKIGDL